MENKALYLLWYVERTEEKQAGEGNNISRRRDENFVRQLKLEHGVPTEELLLAGVGMVQGL